MLEPLEPINFQPLIKALQTATEKATFQEQIAELEIALVSSELNPKPEEFCDLLWAIELLGNIDIRARKWQPIGESLNDFF
ncbi:MAG: hypothetical protein EBR82_41560 [Caulobacteraceae bacterium]|nr:hypothetical protein [Caulobacteraceae bacterium]